MPTDPIKSGTSTSEFWIHALAQISGMAMTFLPGNKYVQMAGAVIQLLNPATYSYLRTNLKKIALDAGAAAMTSIETDLAAGTQTAVQVQTGTPAGVPPSPKA